MRFVLAEILFALGVGVLLHKRWALFGYLALTGLIAVGSFAGVLLMMAHPTRPGINRAVSINAVLVLAIIIPALLLLQTRDSLGRPSDAANEHEAPPADGRSA